MKIKATVSLQPHSGLCVLALKLNGGVYAKLGFVV